MRQVANLLGLERAPEGSNPSSSARTFISRPESRFDINKYMIIEKQCPKCKLTHTKRGIFCSRSCANSRIHSKETKTKISKAFKTNKKWQSNVKKLAILNKKKKEQYKCKICDNYFLALPSDNHNRCNNKKCKEEWLKIYKKGACGGYRKNSGRSKTGFYKGIHCGSTYELVWVIYNLDNNIKFEKCKQKFKYNKKNYYYPDFILDNVIIEIKGYYTDLVDIKKQTVIDAGYDIKILYKEDLLKQFEWVKKNYTYSELYELYDDYQPQYKYKCDECLKEFSTCKKRKTVLKFCSRKCSGKYRKNKNTDP